MNDFIPYGRPEVDDDDIASVLAVLRGEWLTSGPLVERFENAFASYVGASHAVAVSNGTAALHLAILALGIGPGDEVIVPALTFAASANCVRYAGGSVVFADVRDDTLTIDTEHAASLITTKTRAIVAVDYAGLPSDLDELRNLASKHGLVLIEDACHAPGAQYRGRAVGSIADLTAFSFHPVKHLTTGEGGMVTTDNRDYAVKLRILRNHGITSDHRQREAQGTWAYDMTMLGYNYRLTDIQCALGLSQLRKQAEGLRHRDSLAERYTQALRELPLQLPVRLTDRVHAWHLYPIRFIDGPDRFRDTVFASLRQAKIGVNVHYKPVYLHRYYQLLGYRPGLCAVAESAYRRLMSLPMWHGMTEGQQDRVVIALAAAVSDAR